MSILPQLLVNALIAGSIYALVSVGLALTYGLLRILNFAHGHLLMVGAYVFYMFSAELNFSLWASAGLTFLVTLAVGAIALAVFVMPFVRYSFLLPFVTTLALSTMLESIISMTFGVNVKSLSSGMDISSIEIYGVYITPIQIIIIISALVILTLASVVIHHTPLGRRIRALSEHVSAAQSLGINNTAISYGIFIVGAVLATYAGILIGYETNLQPTMGSAYTIKAFAAMILGGLGNIWGTVFGSYILGLIENLSIGLDFGGYSLPAGYKDAFAFAIILLMLLFKPKGIFSRRSRTA